MQCPRLVESVIDDLEVMPIAGLLPNEKNQESPMNQHCYQVGRRFVSLVT